MAIVYPGSSECLAGKEHGQDTLTSQSTLTLREALVNPMCASLGCGRKTESPEKTHAHMGKSRQTTWTVILAIIDFFLINVIMKGPLTKRCYLRTCPSKHNYLFIYLSLLPQLWIPWVRGYVTQLCFSCTYHNKHLWIELNLNKLVIENWLTYRKHMVKS